jgi:hypothetical protein
MAGYLAAIYRWNADLVQIQAELTRRGAGPDEYTAVWEGAVADLESMQPPQEAGDLHGQYLAMADDVASIWTRYSLKSQLKPDEALAEFMQQIADMGVVATQLDIEGRALVMDLLDAGTDPVGVYLSDLLTIQTGFSSSSEAAFKAFGRLATDPAGAFDDIEALVDAVDGMAMQWQSVTAPDQLVGLHNRQLSAMQTYVEIMRDLITAVKSGDEVPQSLQIDLSEVAADITQLNATWSLVIAEHLEGLDAP